MMPKCVRPLDTYKQELFDPLGALDLSDFAQVNSVSGLKFHYLRTPHAIIRSKVVLDSFSCELPETNGSIGSQKVSLTKVLLALP